MGRLDILEEPDAGAFGRDRARFLAALLSDRRVKQLLSAEHFSVDGTMLKAFASMRSFRPKDGSGNPPDGGRNGERNFREEKRSNQTHASTTDPDARLYRNASGQEIRLAYLGHALMENLNGLAVAVPHATGTGQREAALEMAEALPDGATLGADKAYDVEAFVNDQDTRDRAACGDQRHSVEDRHSSQDGLAAFHK